MGEMGSLHKVKAPSLVAVEAMENVIMQCSVAQLREMRCVAGVEQWNTEGGADVVSGVNDGLEQGGRAGSVLVNIGWGIRGE